MKREDPSSGGGHTEALLEQAHALDPTIFWSLIIDPLSLLLLAGFNHRAGNTGMGSLLLRHGAWIGFSDGDLGRFHQFPGEQLPPRPHTTGHPLPYTEPYTEPYRDP